MRRLVLLGMLLATVVLAYATASQRLNLGRLFGGRASQRLPALRSQEIPFQYPAHLWREGVEGEVVLRVHITETGSVDSVELQRSSGHAVLDGVALDGARLLLFHPAEKGGEAVAIWAELPIRFQRGAATITPMENDDD